MKDFYNIKILRNFVLFLREKLQWDEKRLEELFESCGSHLSFLDSDDNWFNQQLADSFYEQVVRYTRDPDIAYKVGAFSVMENARGIGGRIVQGWLSPKIAFKNMQRIAAAYSKGSIYEIVKVSNDRALMRVRVVQGCEEKPYQCRNRIGMLESIPTFFGRTGIRTVHPTCIHTGGPYCEYEFSWREVSRRPQLAASWTAAAVAFAVSRYFSDWGLAAWMAANVGFFTYWLFKKLANQDLQKAITEQNIGLVESVRIMARRSEAQVLLRDIIKRISEMMPIQDLCNLSVELIQQKMEYDRVAIALVNPERKVLQFKSHRGYESVLQDPKAVPEFRIRSDNQDGLLIKVVNNNQALLEPDVLKSMPQYSTRTQAFLKRLGTHALVAVPISFNDEVLGVLTVENSSPLKPLSVNDRDLVASLASNLAVAIINARNFEAVKQAEQEQREAREQFQKYVPTDVVSAHQDPLKRGSTYLESKVLSVMFIDIVGFTTFSEQLPPSHVVEILNVYIEVINEVVTLHGGKINKIIGDGLMIYFSTDSTETLRTGRAILRSVERINECLKQKGYSPIALGIGAHRGPCTIGSIGYDRRLDYTLIGDTVNTAARIEELTRQFGRNVFCFSSALSHEAEAREGISCGTVTLSGRSQEIEVLRFPVESTASLLIPSKMVPQAA